MGRFVVAPVRDRVGRDVDRVERATPEVSRPLVSDEISFRSLLPDSVISPAPQAPGSDWGLGAGPQLSDPLPDLSIEQGSPDTFAVQSTLPEVEDGRRFTFDSVSPLRKRSGTVVRLRTAAPVRGVVTVPHGVTVEARDDVIMCIRRKARRGVILALGQGGGYHRPPKRSPKSDIWC